MNINQSIQAIRDLCRFSIVAATSLLLIGCVTTEELYAEYDDQACRVSLVKTTSGHTVVKELVSDRSMAWEPSVLFALGKDNLGENQKRRLDQDVAVLKRYPELRVSVRGYADASGTALFNRDLAARRAAKVASYLVKSGIDRDRVQQTSLGEGMPIKQAEAEAAVPVNRRVELVLMDVNSNLVRYQVNPEEPPISAATEEE